MINSQTNLKLWIITGIICGILADIVYILATTISITPTINNLLFFSFGPFLIIAVIGIYAMLCQQGETVARQLGTLFLILSGVTHTIMATMQGAIRSVMSGYLSGADTVAEKDLFRNIYRGVFSTQAGVDMAFDIFISIGVILIAYSMWQHTNFGKVVSLLGVMIGSTGLLFNLIAFPDNAANVGLIDPGPFFGAWFLVIVIQMGYFLKTSPQFKNPTN